ncbi:MULTISPECIES: hypothetical protein [Clostridium]|uniref:Uncharacterized protein n=1 Tax=Clostridium frigoriphilum TaxID=443253 RepID=A0ABU7UNC2_9CLOT|nr:hypothetical protein [Clostridium sp. DSM 17811]MBU3098918.1 hypothetical protein [Clostridium sp. DSM 17811]
MKKTRKQVIVTLLVVGMAINEFILPVMAQAATIEPQVTCSLKVLPSTVVALNEIALKRSVVAASSGITACTSYLNNKYVRPVINTAYINLVGDTQFATTILNNKIAVTQSDVDVLTKKIIEETSILNELLETSIASINLDEAALVQSLVSASRQMATCAPYLGCGYAQPVISVKYVELVEDMQFATTILNNKVGVTQSDIDALTKKITEETSILNQQSLFFNIS